MNNTLTAKEWLKTWNIKDSMIYNLEDKYKMDDISDVLEKYANYKNKILEDRIKEFREIFSKDCDDMGELPFRYENKDYFLNQYDKHFNINKETT